MAVETPADPFLEVFYTWDEDLAHQEHHQSVETHVANDLCVFWDRISRIDIGEKIAFAHASFRPQTPVDVQKIAWQELNRPHTGFHRRFRAHCCRRSLFPGSFYERESSFKQKRQSS
jgi:hypothetical protein